MRILRFLILLPVFFFTLLFVSCDDAGEVKQYVQKGLITFTHSNLKPLDPNQTGLYVLWLGLDSSGVRIWHDLGHFNISGIGELVDSLGFTKTFFYAGDTNSLGYSSVACVTVGSTPDYQVIISSPLSIGSDSITGHLKISGDQALNGAGKRILGEGYPRANGYYILNSPTTGNSECLKGIWFSDTSGNVSFTEGLSLNQGKGWIFEAWVHDKINNFYYSMGRFYDFYTADLDGAGPCKGPSGNGFNKPGQDFIQTGSGCPTVTNLGSGNFGVFVTLEPENESSPSITSPFYLKLFWQQTISNTLGCNRGDPYISNQTNFGAMPFARISITY